MARPILSIKPDNKSKTVTHSQIKKGRLSDPLVVESKLRQKRSPAYSQAVLALDAGEHHHNQEAIDAFIESLKKEFPEIPEYFLPLGLVARCYLGGSYQVHIVDLAGNIVEHFKIGQSLPNDFEGARSLALHPAYNYVEVYPDKLIAIAADGSSSIIRR